MVRKMDVGKLQEGLQTRCLGSKILFSRKIGSTNDWAKELASHGASEGTVVIAEVQTSGRGRLSRKWISPKGGLWFSVVLRPRLAPASAAKLVFVAGLAVAEVLRDIYGLRVETKWPNDVLVNGRKICGILSEMKTTGEKVNHAIVGIGVNGNFEVDDAFPEDLRKVATSLKRELGRRVRLDELFSALLVRLESLYETFLEGGFSKLLDEWKGFAGFLGREVEIVTGTERLCGLACDVDDEGAFVVRLSDGSMRRVFAGDVSLHAK